MAATVLAVCRSNSSADPGSSAVRRSARHPAEAPREGVEVVEQVHPGHLDRTTDVRCGRRARVDGREGDALTALVDRAQPVRVSAGRVARPGVGHHTGRVGRRVAATQGVRRAERLTAATADDRVGVLAVEGVVDDQLVEVVLRLECDRLGTGRDDVGGLLQAAAGGHRHLAEAAELEVLGDVERLRHRHRHALVPLEGVGVGHRQRHLGGRDRAGTAGGHGRLRRSGSGPRTHRRCLTPRRRHRPRPSCCCR